MDFTTNDTVWVDSSGAAGAGAGGYGRMAVAQLGTVWVPASSRMLMSGPLVKLGGSLTAVAVMVKVWVALTLEPPLAVPPLSCAKIVTVAVPLALGAT